MDKITRIKNTSYTTISNIPLRDRKLSLKAKGLLAVVMSLPDEWDFSIKGICSIMKEGSDSIYSCIRELKNNGYCTVERCRNEKGYLDKSDYTFYETPIHPHADNPYMENPRMDNPRMDNPPQINKERNNIKKEIIKESSSIEENAAAFSFSIGFIINLYNDIFHPDPQIESNSINCMAARKIMAAVTAAGISEEDLRTTFRYIEQKPSLSGIHIGGVSKLIRETTIISEAAQWEHERNRKVKEQKEIAEKTRLAKETKKQKDKFYKRINEIKSIVGDEYWDMRAANGDVNEFTDLCGQLYQIFGNSGTEDEIKQKFKELINGDK